MQRLKDILRLRRGPRSEETDVAPPLDADNGKKPDVKGSFSIRVDDKAFDELRIILAGKVEMDNADLVRKELLWVIETEPLKNVVIDLNEVEYFDSSGAAILVEMFQACHRVNNTLRLMQVPKRIETVLALVDFEHYKTEGILQPLSEPGFVTQVGEGFVALGNNSRDILTFIGACVEALARDLIRPSRAGWERLWKLIERAGANAVPITAILGFLMGGVLGFQAAIQLKKFGANIFVADLVSLAICLEMGPLMTALIVSGRSGAGYAAHIGTMAVNEEIDALRVMGIDPIRYLVSPRILAVAFALPCLTLFADLLGVAGGCLVAMVSLDLTPVGYYNQVHRVLELTDVLKGLTKSLVFGVEIAIIGCLRGFQVRGGAESVGVATTSAVVTCVFVITITDAIFAVLFYYAPSLW